MPPDSRLHSKENPIMASDLTSNQSKTSSRRDFLKASTATMMGAALASELAVADNVHAGGSDVIRVGLIGCGSPRGGRGRGAAEQCLLTGKGVKLIAMADAFKDHLDFTRDYLTKRFKDEPEKIDVPDDRAFVGLDGYQKVCSLK